MTAIMRSCCLATTSVMVMLMVAVTARSALADDLAGDSVSPVKFSGFATLALTHNDNSQAGAIVSWAQKTPAKMGWSGNLDSDLGVQMDWQLARNTSVVVQTVARLGDEMRPEARLTYVRQQLSPEVAARFGRIRSPLFFDSDVAEIGYGYMMSRPPIPVYGILNSVNHLDGGDIQWRPSFDNTAFLVQGYYASSKYKQQFYSNGTEAQAELQDIRGLALSASLPNITMRASRTWVGSDTIRSSSIDQLNAGLTGVAGGLRMVASNPMLPQTMAAGYVSQANQVAGMTNSFDSTPTFTSLGFDGNFEAWRLMGEWTELNSHSAMVGKFQGFHLSLGYAIGDFTPYVSVARLDRKSSSLNTSALAVTSGSTVLDTTAALVKTGLDQSSQSADLSSHSASIGMRWDFRENMAIKMQYDRILTPSPLVPGSLAVPVYPFNNKVNLFTAAVDVIF